MASVTKTNNELLWSQSVLLLAATGTFPTEEVGMTRQGTTISVTKDVQSDNVQEFLGPVDKRLVAAEVKIAGSLAQFNVDTLQRVLGYPGANKKISIGGGMPEVEELAALLVGTTKGKSPVHVYLPACKSLDDFEISLQKESPTDMGFGLHWIDGPGRAVEILLGMASATATIATGTFARVNTAPTEQITHVRMAGESAAADVLTDITLGATTLADGERIRLQISSATMPITITHASGVIELKTSADFVMTKTADWIDLYYDLTNTTWKEICRYDAV